MPLSCAAYGCSNYNQKEEKSGFYRFPNNNAVLRKKSINACKCVNKDGTPWNRQGKNVYICGKHFIYGKSSELITEEMKKTIIKFDIFPLLR